MKNFNWQKIYPHIVAIVIFLLVAVIYCRPALEGKVLQQSDVTQWEGMSKSMQEYADKNGHAPLWTNSMFSGMPGYMIIGYSNNALPAYFIGVLSLFFPAPFNFFFLACICFYFLSQVMRIRPWVGIIGALMYPYATYNPIIVSVGHITKIISIALMPGFVASLLLIFDKKYWIGTALATFFTAALVAENHYQIVYYTVLIAVFMGVGFAIDCISKKEYKHLFITIIAGIFAGVVGVATNSVAILPNLEYSKETIRGGSQIGATGKEGEAAAKTGLNEDYAFSYSLSLSEPFVLLVPRMFGGSSGGEEVKQESSKAIEALQSMPQELAQQLGYPRYYWGGINGVGTSGPPYIGAIVCFLAILGFIIADKKYRWWILSCCAITIIMSWGGYFKGINLLFLKYLPMYDKFRAPSMILVVPTLLLVMMAVLALEKILTPGNDTKYLLAQYKKAIIIIGGIFLLLFFLYMSFDYLSMDDQDILKRVSSIPDEQVKSSIKSFFSALQEDRKGLFMGDLIRSLLFIAVAAISIFLYLKGKIKSIVLITLIGVFAFIDIMGIDVKYMSADDFVTKDDYENAFVPAAVDMQIMQDTGYYRVLDLRQGIGNAFNSGALTAYFHNSIGGYHPAKLSIYQDIIDSQLYRFPNCLPVIDMLNTKYVIGQDGKAQQNPMALGNAWFVKHVTFLETPKAVMKALDTFDPGDTAIAEISAKNILHDPATYDSAATIKMLTNNNDTITYKSNTFAEQLAVFSEVYYSAGWKVFVDGKETPYTKVNYVLRGMMVPAGEHTIQFIFRPESHMLGWKISTASHITMSVLMLVAIVVEIRRRKQGQFSFLKQV